MYWNWGNCIYRWKTKINIASYFMYWWYILCVNLNLQSNPRYFFKTFLTKLVMPTLTNVKIVNNKHLHIVVFLWKIDKIFNTFKFRCTSWSFNFLLCHLIYIFRETMLCWKQWYQWLACNLHYCIYTNVYILRKSRHQ